MWNKQSYRQRKHYRKGKKVYREDSINKCIDKNLLINMYKCISLHKLACTDKM